MKELSCGLNSASIRLVIDELKEYRKTFSDKVDEVCKKVADIAQQTVTIYYDSTPYHGDRDYTVEVVKIDNGYMVEVSGTAHLFLEFGAGVKYASAYPSGEFNASAYGVGTYPNQTHAFDKNGWWFTTSNGSQHTYGNPPSAGMYHAKVRAAQSIEYLLRGLYND